MEESHHQDSSHHTTNTVLKRPSTTPTHIHQRPSTAIQLQQRPSTEGRARTRMTTINHKMPQSAVEKRKERLLRARSAPLLNSEVRNERLCREVSNEQTDISDVSPAKEKRKPFKVSRPQYLQYIKSSTGIIEEDYFADIFPEQEEKPKDMR